MGLARRATTVTFKRAVAALAVFLLVVPTGGVAGADTTSTTTLLTGAIIGTLPPSPFALTNLSCWSLGNCAGIDTANNGYVSSAAGTADVIIEHNGIFGAAIAVAGNVNQAESVQLNEVQCFAPGTCLAAGSSIVAAQSTAIVAFVRNGSWLPASPLPQLSALPDARSTSISQLSCVSATCVVLGSVTTGAGAQEAFTDTWSNGAWTTPTVLSMHVPVGGAFATSELATSLTCFAAGDCTISGQLGNSLAGGLFFAQEVNGHWRPSTVIANTVAAPGAVSSGNNLSSSWVVDVMTCVAATTCMAGGSYYDAGARTQGFVVSERAGVWTVSNLPGLAQLNAGAVAGKSNDLGAQVTSIVCPSSNMCVASGDYAATSGSSGVFVDVSYGQKWGRAVALPGVDAFSSLDAAPTGAYAAGLSCSSPSTCVVVGDYSFQDSSIIFSSTATNGVFAPATEVNFPTETDANNQSFFWVDQMVSAGSVTLLLVTTPLGGAIVNLRSGSWGTAQNLVLSSALPSNSDASVDAVSCPSDGNCVAVGDGVTDTNSIFQVNQGGLFTAEESHGVWQPTEVIPSSVLANAQSFSVDGLSCVSVGNCVVVGEMDLSPTVSYVLVERDGVWGTLQKLAGLPVSTATGQNAPSELEAFSALSCTSLSQCLAVGNYVTTNGTNAPFVVTDLLSGNATATTLSLPSVAVPGNVRVDALQCPSVGHCVMGADIYRSHHQAWEPSIVSGNGSTWTAPMTLPGIVALNSATTGLDSTSVGFTQLVCPDSSDCAVAGYYENSRGSLEFVDAESAGVWTSAELLPGLTTIQPANVIGSNGVALTSVACSSPGACVIVGNVSSESWSQGGAPTATFYATLSGGTWQPATFLPVSPGNFGAQYFEADGVGCHPGGSCVIYGTNGVVTVTSSFDGSYGTWGPTSLAMVSITGTTVGPEVGISSPTQAALINSHVVCTAQSCTAGGVSWSARLGAVPLVTTTS